MKKYLNISEVSKILDLKEHIIRYWDSIDPKTNKLRVDGISIKSNGGTRYFNKENINKLKKLKELLYENGNQNHSITLANRFLSNSKKSLSDPNIHKNLIYSDSNKNFKKIRVILENMRIM